MSEFKNIKNIIFDLGNVLCDIDFKRTVDAFQTLGGDKIDLNLENYMDHPIFGGIEKGEISAAQFRDQIREMLQSDASDDIIDEAWSAVIVKSDIERIKLIKSLRKNYRIFILSNTDEIHIARATQLFKDDFDIDFFGLFEKCYYSHELALEKPGFEIYNTVLADAGIKAEETLFIDDKADNIEAAKQLGIMSYLFDNKKEKLEEIFNSKKVFKKEV